MFHKLAAVACVCAGEALSIEAELLGSKRIVAHNARVLSIYLPMFALITLAGALLIGGYMLGLLYFKNIWVVTALSIGSILIIEPVLAWVMFHQAPTTGATLGLAFGTFGILSAAFF